MCIDSTQPYKIAMWAYTMGTFINPEPLFMNNKNILTILIILAVVVVALLTFTRGNQTAPPSSNTPDSKMVNTDYVEMTVAEAEEKAQADGVMFRVVEEDGKPLPTTKDLRPGRINATVEDGVVTGYTVERSIPATDEPTADETSTNQTGDHDTIIGMTTNEAEAYARQYNVPFRITMLDGEMLPATMDYRPGRISAQVENDIVVGYTVEQAYQP